MLLAMLAGCASTLPIPEAAQKRLPPRAELTSTPFYPQDQHQCGPASLATVLNAAGHAADPKLLEPALYVPDREGAFQAEMLAAARRQGAFAVPAARNVEDLFAEIAAGRPVVILQNLGLNWTPRWHYAVVIGYDLAASEVVLRSGVTQREVMSLRTFDRTWARSGRWAMVVSPPGSLPVTAAQADIEQALPALEKFSSSATMITHYQTAVRRWPGSLLLQVGLGNMLAQDQQLEAAEAAFRQAVHWHPDSAVALNNLASVLHSQGQWDEALKVADQAVGAAANSTWAERARATREEIRSAMRVSAPSSP